MTTIAPATTPLETQIARPAWWTFLPRALWPIIVSVAIGLIFNFEITNRYIGNLTLFCGIAIILATSLTVVNGFTGQFSIGHAGFMSLGGYTAAAIMYYGSFKLFGSPKFHGGLLSYTGISHFKGGLWGPGDWLFLAAIFIAGIVAAAVGWLVGLPSLRLRGDYLAIVTLGFGEIVRVLLQGTPEQLHRSQAKLIVATPWPKLLTKLGGALGFIGIPTYATLFWVWTFVGITLAAIIRLKRSSYGRALLSVREDEIAAQAMGVNITRYKVVAFSFSAFFAGVAGALYATQIGSINAGELAFQKSFDIVIMVVLGGLGSISGAALAAIILTVLPELLRDPPSIWPWGIVGAAVIAVLILLFAPRKRGPLLTLIGVCIGWEFLRWIANRLGIDLSEYRMVLYSLALIIIMIVRPQGLFGVREIWDYLPVLTSKFKRGRSAT